MCKVSNTVTIGKVTSEVVTQTRRGKVDASEKGGSLVLDSRNAGLDLPVVFPEPRLALGDLKARATWLVDGNNLDVRLDRLEFAGRDAFDAALGDAVYGIDNTFAGRALAGDILEPYESPNYPKNTPDLSADTSERLTPIDFGDVCVNADSAWFAANDVPVPTTLDDLTAPAYKELFVVPSPTSSSPGQSFLLATIGAKGDGWVDYWKALEDNGVKAKVLTSIRMEPIGEYYSKARAIEYLEVGYVVIIGGGTSNPYFSTDSASALRGIELEADVMLKGTRVDGVYTADPEKDPAAEKFDEITFDEVYRRNLKVMDMTAFTLCRENGLRVIVFDMDTPGNLEKVLAGEKIGTLVKL